MPEQFSFDQILWNRCHVDRNERSIAPSAVVVERPRDQFFAGSGFARDRHRQVHADQTRDNSVDFLHGCGTANQWQTASLFVLSFDRRFGKRRA